MDELVSALMWTLALQFGSDLVCHCFEDVSVMSSRTVLIHRHFPLAQLLIVHVYFIQEICMVSLIDWLFFQIGLDWTD